MGKYGSSPHIPFHNVVKVLLCDNIAVPTPGGAYASTKSRANAHICETHQCAGERSTSPSGIPCISVVLQYAISHSAMYGIFTNNCTGKKGLSGFLYE